jgi:hypothetical protein
MKGKGKKIALFIQNEPLKVCILCALVVLVVYSPALLLAYWHSLSAPIVKVSSQLDKFGPEGLFDLEQPGWHAAIPVTYPQTIQVDLRNPRKIQSFGFLSQDNNPLRAPKAIRIEISDGGDLWTPIIGSDNLCREGADGKWHNVVLESVKKIRFLKVIIFSNCGDPEFLTLRGLKVE